MEFIQSRHWPKLITPAGWPLDSYRLAGNPAFAKQLHWVAEHREPVHFRRASSILIAKTRILIAPAISPNKLNDNSRRAIRLALFLSLAFVSNCTKSSFMVDLHPSSKARAKHECR